MNEPSLLPVINVQPFSGAAARPLGAWLALVVLINVLFCTTGGYGGDIGYWSDWVKQLQSAGYAQLDANYPPVYIHWLWLIAKFDAALKIPVAPDVFLRFLTHSPIVLTHVALLFVSDRLLSRAENTSDTQWNFVIGLVALNPAIVMNGPIWGQVDLFFSLMLVVVLFLLIESRCLGLVFPLLVTAVLTKFQSICIAPVLLPLLWHRRCRNLWLGMLPAILIGALLLLPYLLAGSTLRMLDLTYLKAASLYPYATYNANNLWYLLGLNSRPDGLFIGTFLNPATPWQKLFTPKLLGMFLCSVWGLAVMISSWRRDDNGLHWRNAFLAALGFFLFLPAMHERYMLPAVVIALAAAARHARFNIHAVVLSVLCAANMVFVLHPTGGLLSWLFSGLTLLFAFCVLLPACLTARLVALKDLPLREWSLIAVSIWIFALTLHLHLVLPKLEGWVDATKISARRVEQDWGELRVDASVSNNALSINKRQFKNGFGTHAASTITIPVPANAQTFSALVGIDDESTIGEVEFIVRLDGTSAWRSGRMKSGSDARPVLICVKGAHSIELIVDPQGSNTGDHANWIEPRFSLAK